MTIDITQPWYPQDYSIEEVIEVGTRSGGFNFTDDAKRNRIKDIEEDYRIRKLGPAGIFYDLRRHLRQALHGKQLHQMPNHDRDQKWKRTDENGCFVVNEERFMGTVDEVISLAIAKLEGASFPDTRFVVMDYAAPVVTRDQPPDYNCTPSLLEATRPCNNILQNYWDMVNSEEKTTE